MTAMGITFGQASSAALDWGRNAALGPGDWPTHVQKEYEI